MNNLNEHTENQGVSPDEPYEFDFTYVSATARIALYDDLRSAPRITEIPPAETTSYIESLASKIYEQSKMAGGSIPYTVIREVSENFIHARFKEIIVSILDNGNTIRFADQGPGIRNKDKAQLPGFSSAVEPMKKYIRGVGSGLPIVKEYLGFSHGTITIEDNLGAGSVVTISMVDNQESLRDRAFPRISEPQHGIAASREAKSGGYSSYEEYREAAGLSETRAARSQALVPPLTPREREFLPLFLSEGELGVTEISRLTDVPASSTHVTLQKLEQAGLIEKVGRKRALTNLGFEVAQNL